MKRKLSEGSKKNIAYEQEYKCANCRNLLPPSYQVDHIIPHSISNCDERENLEALCPNCHANKTQLESKRIFEYKALLNSCDEGVKICWFCLQSADDEEDERSHKCSRTLVDIPKLVKKQQETINTFEEMCSKFKYIKLNQSENSILTIKIVGAYVYVDNFFTKLTRGVNARDVAKAVRIATRTKRNTGRYTKVCIVTEPEYIEMLGNELPDLMPTFIFKDGDIEYEFV